MTLFPATSTDRAAWVRTPAGDLVAAPTGTVCLIYEAATGSTLATVTHTDARAVTDTDPLVVDGDSLWERFLDPSDRTRLWISIDDGPRTEIYADLQDQIDSIGAGGGGVLLAENNLDDLASPAAARTNLGLGSAATQPSSAFAAGSHAAQHAAAGADPVTSPAILRRTAATYAATITPDISTSDLVDVGTLAGDVTIATPTGIPVDGQVLRLRLAQDATGSRAVTFGAAYVFGSDVTADLIPTEPDARWVMMAMYHAGASEWWIVSIVRGY